MLIKVCDYGVFSKDVSSGRRGDMDTHVLWDLYYYSGAALQRPCPIFAPQHPRILLELFGWGYDILDDSACLHSYLSLRSPSYYPHVCRSDAHRGL